MKKLAMIVLNYNTYDDTVKCVNQLISLDIKINIIIVDNASSDKSGIKLKKMFVDVDDVDVILESNNNGYSAGNNIGMRYAIEKYQVDIVGIINPDVIVPNENVLKKMSEYLFYDEKYAVIGASVINEDKLYNQSTSSWSIPSNKEIILNHSLLHKRTKKSINVKMIDDKLATVDCILGSLVLAKSNVMKEIGFLDEGVFLYNEENLLGIKVKQNGYMEIQAMNLFYYHNHRKVKKEISLIKKVTATKKSFQSRCYLCKKYYPHYLLPVLYGCEGVNRVFLFFCFIKGIIFK